MKSEEDRTRQFFSSRLGVCRHCGHPFLLPPRTGGPIRSSYTRPCPKCGRPVKVKL
jgi:hypothetical protein